MGSHHFVFTLILTSPFSMKGAKRSDKSFLTPPGRFPYILKLSLLMRIVVPDRRLSTPLLIFISCFIQSPLLSHFSSSYARIYSSSLPFCVVATWKAFPRLV